MNHIMTLFQEPFDKIQTGQKNIEVRLNDDKRQQVKIGDTITFYRLPDQQVAITVEVQAKYPYQTFEQLYAAFDFSEFGCLEYTMDRMVSETYDIYTKQQEETHGALGIKIKVIDNP
ncbi:MAG: ASCH domain-containing protein [Turicibacter sp.]